MYWKKRPCIGNGYSSELCTRSFLSITPTNYVRFYKIGGNIRSYSSESAEAALSIICHFYHDRNSIWTEWNGICCGDCSLMAELSACLISDFKGELTINNQSCAQFSRVKEVGGRRDCLQGVCVYIYFFFLSEETYSVESFPLHCLVSS